jgi:phosphoribosylformimino-5-aminoimidazole carboxamide ribotide isomerase
MRIIPVLDLAGDVAVHAVRGERDRYLPVKSRLAPEAGADPVRLLLAYRDRLGVDTCYVADLDAIRGVGSHAVVLAAMAAAAPAVTLWTDDGGADPEAALALLAPQGPGARRVVVGTETLSGLEAFGAIADALGPARMVASLDLRDGRLLWGAPARATCPADPLEALDAAARAGVEAVILLDLSRVGAGAGPDLDLVRRASARQPGLALFAGGGVRDAADLDALERAGAAGALVATAIHAGRLSAAEVRARRALRL